MKRGTALRLWVSRILIGIVVVWNLQCALIFFLTPDAFTPGFELVGLPGAVAVRGTAVLFLMWNIPYLVALWNPLRYHVSLWEALAMQLAGLIGESVILLLLPPGHAVLKESIMRFIVFDGTGLILLVSAILLLKNKRSVLIKVE